jgi:hypothetical protein
MPNQLLENLAETSRPRDFVDPLYQALASQQRSRASLSALSDGSSPVFEIGRPPPRQGGADSPAATAGHPARSPDRAPRPRLSAPADAIPRAGVADCVGVDARRAFARFGLEGSSVSAAPRRRPLSSGGPSLCPMPVAAGRSLWTSTGPSSVQAPQVGFALAFRCSIRAATHALTSALTKARRPLLRSPPSVIRTGCGNVFSAAIRKR